MSASGAPLSRLFLEPTRGVPAVVALAVAALHAYAMGRYGYFRDELYYLACAQHLDLGYVDHPPFSIGVLAVVRALFGVSLPALRMVPLLANVAVVLVTGALVRRMGGGVFACALACTALALAPVFLAFGHFYSMNALDAVFWVAAAWLLLDVLEAPTDRRWALLGVVLGLGLENKASILWLGAGIGATLVLLRRDLLRTRGPWLAAGVAALLFAPNVVWEVRHGWPTLEFARNAMEGKYKEHSVAGFFAGAADVMSPAALPLFAVGAVAPLFVRAMRPRPPGVAAGAHERTEPGGRALAIVVLTTTAILATSRSAKPEYLAAAFPLALAPGAVVLEGWLSGRRWIRAARWALLVAVVGRGALSVPFVVPVLRVERFLAYQEALGAKPDSTEKKDMGPLPQLYADMFGWKELADAAEVAASTLTPEERAHAGVLSRTGYGAASAIELFGPPRGLPHGISGHNNFYYWGPREADGRAMIVLGGERSWAEERFESVVAAGRFDCRLCMPYEAHKTIWVARGLKQPLAEFWEERRHFE
jgi:hypothetical protein